MKYDSEIHHRRSIRLSGYDYSSPGAYFVTICTKDRLCLFGEIINDEMRVNDAGCMIEKYWLKLPNKFPHIQINSFITMPNHFHGIIKIVGADPRVCPDKENEKGAHTGAPLHKVVQWFKTMTTNAYIKGVKDSDWAGFPGKLWQRNYYEHVIRNDDSMNVIREYIEYNPSRWIDDVDNPDNITKESGIVTNGIYKI